MIKLSEKYKIIQQFGTQTKRKFGSVYLVQHKLNGELAVLKTIKKLSNNKHIQDRIKQESEFTFTHKNLPETIDFIETDSEIILIKRFLPGIPLDLFWKKIKRKNKLKVLIEILEKLAVIMDYLQEQNIVHCDIKPSNILINEEDSKLDVSLIDFGLAIKLSENNKRSILFPLGYAAPELILNKLDLVDQRTDLFSVGIVIWRLLNDKLPLTHPNPSIFTNLQLTHPLPDGNELLKGLNDLLRKMCTKPSFRTSPNLLQENEIREELSKAIKNRFENLNEFLDSLKKLTPTKKWFFF